MVKTVGCHGYQCERVSQHSWVGSFHLRKRGSGGLPRSWMKQPGPDPPVREDHRSLKVLPDLEAPLPGEDERS